MADGDNQSNDQIIHTHNKVKSLSPVNLFPVSNFSALLTLLSDLVSSKSPYLLLVVSIIHERDLKKIP